MEKIDQAFQQFQEIKKWISQNNSSIFTEQDTRLKVIDRIFLEALGWKYEDVMTEARAGSGFIDYKFNIAHLSRLIVEAKRDGNDLGLKLKKSGRAYKLCGPVFDNKIVQKRIIISGSRE